METLKVGMREFAISSPPISSNRNPRWPLPHMATRWQDVLDAEGIPRMGLSPVSNSGGLGKSDDRPEAPCAQREHSPPNRLRGARASLLETYEDSVSFYAPKICFADARKYIASISEKCRIEAGPGILVLDHLLRLVESADRSLYEEY
jgi:hypothetical protein